MEGFDWNQGLQTLANAGVGAMQARSDASARTNNATGVPPSQAGLPGGLPKWALWGGLGLIGVLVAVVALKRR